MSKRTLIPMAGLAVALAVVLIVFLSGRDPGGLDDPRGPSGPDTAGREAAPKPEPADGGEDGTPPEESAPEAVHPTALVVRVTDADARPVPGATVRLVRRDEFESGSYWDGPSEDQILTGSLLLEEGKEPPGVRHATGSDGTVRIEGLAPGSWFFDASARGFATAAGEAGIPAEGQAEARVALEPGVAISGTILDIRKRAVPGARVIALPWDDMIRFPYSVTEVASGGEDGTFAIEGLTRGVEYLLFARAGNGQLGLAMRVEAPAEGVEVVCGPRFRLRGTVVDDETGEALAGVRLFTILGSATTDEHGAYDLKGMVKSPFFRYVWLQREGYQSTEAEVELASSFLGGPVVTMDFRMTKFRPAELLATIRDTTGRPVAGATVSITGWGDDTVQASAVSGASGEARLPGLNPRGVGIRVTKPGYVFVHVPGEPGGANRANPADRFWVGLPAGETKAIDLTMAATTSLTIGVVNEAGEPIPNAAVTVGSLPVGTTGENGEISTDLVPRNHTFHLGVGKEGYASRSTQVTGGAADRIEVVLSRGVTISGLVVDGADRPLGGVEVSLRRGENAWIEAETVTEPDGTFAFAGLEPGDGQLLAVRDGFAPTKTGKLSLAEGESRSGVRIRLEPGARVRIALEAPDGRSVRGSFWLIGPLGRPEGERLTFARPVDPEDPPEFRVPPGRYRVLATPSKGESGVGAVDVEMDLGESEDVRVRLSDEVRTLLVRVKKKESTSVAAISVKRIEPAIPPLALWINTNTAREDGLFESEPLLPGKYHLQVYYRTAEEAAVWMSFEVEDASPGPEPIEVDLTK